MKHSRAYLGIDTGGTFTDLVLLTQDGTIIVKKVDNLSSKYERNILRATLDILGEAGVSGGKGTPCSTTSSGRSRHHWCPGVCAAR